MIRIESGDTVNSAIREAFHRLACSADTLAPIDVDAPTSMELSRRIVRQVVAQQHDRPSLVAEIAIEIGAEIIEGARHPGDDLNTVDLARRFSTSRTPIREALLLLETQGLIVVPPRRRPRVAPSDVDLVHEIYELRSRLLEMAAAHIAARASETEIILLRQMIADMERAKHSLRAFLWSNVVLHDYMTSIGGNRLARKVVESLLLRTLPLRRLSLAQPDRLLRSLDDHRRLLKAIEDHDADLAIALVRSNHLSALRNVLQALERDRAAGAP